MRRYNLFIVSLMASILLFTSCEVEEDDNGLTPREKFLGTWRFNESELKSDLAFYTVRIDPDPANSAQVILRNFANVGNTFSVFGIVTADRITVTTQTISSVTVSGSGTLTSNTRMQWTYTVNDGADLTNYSAVAEKQ